MKGDFWGRVQVGEPASCWHWLGSVSANGYGHFGEGGKTVSAHRRAYELAREPIPKGLIIDHLCRNRICVNPAHLEVVTYSTNTKRGLTGNRTQCAQGHPYDDNNTRYDTKGHRYCRTCRVNKVRAHREKCVKCSTNPDTYAKMMAASA